ncbi:MAG TPA: cellulase family glycosylhydrolase [Gaiellaceae bacterium]|nr:cellulase family glycosylhydrolase [Gaiellaceae bacterium]
MRVYSRYVLLAVAAVGLLATAASTGLASGKRLRTYTTGPTRPMRTALFDAVQLNRPNARGFALTRSAGAQYVRLIVHWRGIAPATPSPDFDPSDPNSPGYSWAGLDATVEAAENAGLTPILNIGATPSWAYANNPSGVNGGTPQIAALGQFARALATHYDGENGDGVPAANVFEVWNEPNLSLNLAPVDASVYRNMVNAVADSVHAVDPANVVVAGDLDPFGHAKSKKQKWYSVRPLAFMRSLLCVSKGAHPHASCKKKVHFDVWSHHPYTYGGPFGHARLRDDVELGDLPGMRAVLQAGVRLGHVVSDDNVQFWVTEFGWDSNPPRPHAAPMALAARWTAESLYSAWHSGVSLLTWFGLEDQRSPSPYKSGLYFHGSSLDSLRPKPVLTAFRFPFVAYRHAVSVSVWGRDATSDTERVAIQHRHGKHARWKTVGYIVANDSGIFRATLRLKTSKADWLRAVAPGSGKSLAFSLTVPHHPNIGPWGSH